LDPNQIIGDIDDYEIRKYDLRMNHRMLFNHTDSRRGLGLKIKDCSWRRRETETKEK